MKKIRFDKTILAIILLDVLSVAASGAIAFLLRFEFSVSEIPMEHLNTWYLMLPIEIGLTMLVFWFRKMYSYLWPVVGFRDVCGMVVSVVLARAAYDLALLILGKTLPRSVLFMGVFFQLFFDILIRCSVRLFHMFHSAYVVKKGERSRIAIFGAGQAGQMLVKELANPENREGTLCALLDDDPAKWGRFIEGVPILGGQEDIERVVRSKRIDQIIFAIPTADAARRQEILTACRKTGCRVRILPDKYQLVEGSRLAQVKNLQIEDLLGRERVHLNTDMLQACLKDRVVLVTGGGGSIGSELCRQIAFYKPARLVILDIYENNAYDIQQELIRNFGSALNLSVEIASVRDADKLTEIFLRHRPDIVFHAAAHKHVPLMENCPSEAIKNNIFGTYNAVCAAEKAGVKRFVMISTDKAVNPTNVMGATKRFCEMILQSRIHSATEFCAVRFGNVLGSNGSVIPLFRRQIEEGGPVTITDKRIIRYFMLIPEAAQLVLECGAMAQRGQIFVLDMGEPMKILTLAENMIRLSGYEPYKDIAIEEIGLRPGEKLYEELLIDSNTLMKTEHQKIFVEQQEAIDPARVEQYLETLRGALQSGAGKEELAAILRQFVPTFHTPEEVNGQAEDVLHGAGAAVKV